MEQKKPTMLIILDGYGVAKISPYNAITHAHTPHLDFLFTHYPHTTLCASGTAVGLLSESIGNSEVGHLTIGAGRIIQQPIALLHKIIDDETFFTHPLLSQRLAALKMSGNAVHIIGLLSDAGVHAHEKHLWAFIKIATDYGINNVQVHAILDGRDVQPKTAAAYLDRLMYHKGSAHIASIQGRFYAMDRDNNWDRIKDSYDMFIAEKKPDFQSWQHALDYYYEHGITDEFIPPTVLPGHVPVQDGDGIIFCNFRADRARQLSSCFVNQQFDHFQKKNKKLAFFITPVTYGNDLHTDVVLYYPKIDHVLKKVLVSAGKRVVTVAETEKAVPITYFFDGYNETVYEQEQRIFVPSIKSKDYVHHPAMSAAQITETLCTLVHKNETHFYIVNFANADMVGHSGNFESTKKAIEYLDQELEKIYTFFVEKMDGTLYITSDHGKAEDMFDTITRQPRTAHTSNPVPFIMVQQDLYDSSYQLFFKTLADIAPFILKRMGLVVPFEMK